jgi:hypothetical protein
MAPVNERISETKNMMFVVRVAVFVKLCIIMINMDDAVCKLNGSFAYHFQDCNFHHTLIEVGWFVLYDLHRYDLVCLHVLAFDHLSECPLAQNI